MSQLCSGHTHTWPFVDVSSKCLLICKSSFSLSFSSPSHLLRKLGHLSGRTLQILDLTAGFLLLCLSRLPSLVFPVTQLELETWGDSDSCFCVSCMSYSSVVLFTFSCLTSGGLLCPKIHVFNEWFLSAGGVSRSRHGEVRPQSTELIAQIMYPQLGR